MTPQNTQLLGINMKILELEQIHFEPVKDLLVDLQKYVISIDKYNLNIISKDYREKYFEFMLDDCKANQGKVFVALDRNRVVGMVAGFVQEYDERDRLEYSCPKKGIVAELIVDKHCRAKGVGTQLLKQIENYFKSINCEFVQIDVFAYNDNAKKFYYKNGYEDRMVTVFKKL